MHDPKNTKIFLYDDIPWNQTFIPLISLRQRIQGIQAYRKRFNLLVDFLFNNLHANELFGIWSSTDRRRNCKGRRPMALGVPENFLDVIVHLAWLAIADLS